MKKLILSLLMVVGLNANSQTYFTTNIAASSFNELAVNTPVLITSLTIFATNTTSLRFYAADTAAWTNLAYTAQGQAIVTYTSYVTNFYPVESSAGVFATNTQIFTNTWQGLRTTNYSVAANRGTERPRLIEITVPGNGTGNPALATTVQGRWYAATGLSVSNSTAAAATIVLQMNQNP